MTRRFRDEMRQNEPAASVAWLQIGLGVIMIVAGSILLYSAFAGAY
ncbi:hypothetical protein [Ligilactobacillus pobuzihii]|nr:hypothetical protein [Ligilactobacillus pobuzihii]